MGISYEVKKGIILAAGDGSRLGYQTADYPKVLLSADGKSLVNYAIEALAAAGIREVAIVTGYLSDKVKAVLGSGDDFGVRLHYIFNPDYLGGNAFSLYQAKEWTEGDPVVLCMGDHMVEPNITGRLLDRQTINDVLCVDYTPAGHHCIDEATKVNIDDGGGIREIGKDIVDWNALDTGVFLLTGNFFATMDELVPRLGIDIEINDVIRFFIRRGNHFYTCDVSGCFWADVDTEQDLRNAVGELG
ncbi:MAG: NTP transferase domain-containing protein [Dehalococcoidales bacterium]|jgi:choline kinase|nr:NTP transferase domain-containing protein [Dehalococcoidales bacterium]MDP7415307.1 NTP transferase domain-containing protein [Dehalococcoidales bacterium]